MMRLEFHPEASAELLSGVRYYHQQQPGLGERFIAAMEAALGAVLDAPLAGPVLEQDVRRRLTRVFPYAILYSVEPDRIFVLAVMHCHPMPGDWRSRVGA